MPKVFIDFKLLIPFRNLIYNLGFMAIAIARLSE